MQDNSRNSIEIEYLYKEDYCIIDGIFNQVNENNKKEVLKKTSIYESTLEEIKLQRRFKEVLNIAQEKDLIMKQYMYYMGQKSEKKSMYYIIKNNHISTSIQYKNILRASKLGDIFGINDKMYFNGMDICNSHRMIIVISIFAFIIKDKKKNKIKKLPGCVWKFIEAALDKEDGIQENGEYKFDIISDEYKNIFFKSIVGFDINTDFSIGDNGYLLYAERTDINCIIYRLKKIKDKQSFQFIEEENYKKYKRSNTVSTAKKMYISRYLEDTIIAYMRSYTGNPLIQKKIDIYSKNQLCRIKTGGYIEQFQEDTLSQLINIKDSTKIKKIELDDYCRFVNRFIQALPVKSDINLVVNHYIVDQLYASYFMCKVSGIISGSLDIEIIGKKRMNVLYRHLFSLYNIHYVYARIEIARYIIKSFLDFIDLFADEKDIFRWSRKMHKYIHEIERYLNAREYLVYSNQFSCEEYVDSDFLKLEFGKYPDLIKFRANIVSDDLNDKDINKHLGNLIQYLRSSWESYGPYKR